MQNEQKENSLSSRPIDYPAQIEQLMADTIDRVADMHDRLRVIETAISLLPEIKLMLSAIATAQSTMAQAAQNMADTHLKAETRYSKMEERYEELAKTATGKDQIPLKSHYWTVMICLVPTVVMALGVVLGVLYITRQDLTASLTEIQVNQRKTQELVKDAQEKVETKIIESTADRRSDDLKADNKK